MRAMVRHLTTYLRGLCRSLDRSIQTLERGSQAEDRVLQFITAHNRPWNVLGVSDHLAQFGVKKARVQRALDTLSEGGKVTCKEFGKAKLYLPLQPDEAGLSKEARTWFALFSALSCMVASTVAERRQPAPARSWRPCSTAMPHCRRSSGRRATRRAGSKRVRSRYTAELALYGLLPPSSCQA